MSTGPVPERSGGTEVLKAIFGGFAGVLATIVVLVLFTLLREGIGVGDVSSDPAPPAGAGVGPTSSPAQAQVMQPGVTPAAAVPAAEGTGLQVCNRSTERSALALGFRDGDTWMSAGWRAIERGQCLPVAERIAGQTFYYRAVGERGGSWGSDYTLCLQPDAAFRTEATTDCEARGFQTALFNRLEIPAGRDSYTLTLTGGTPDPLDELEEGDGVYVQGWLADEMSIVMRVDRDARRVKVRRSEDLTTVWVPADRIITREQAQLNEVGRTATVLTIGLCMLFPDKCEGAASQ